MYERVVGAALAFGCPNTGVCERRGVCQASGRGHPHDQTSSLSPRYVTHTDTRRVAKRGVEVRVLMLLLLLAAKGSDLLNVGV